MIDIHEGDCLNILPALPADSAQLIITSPPYANMRKGYYPSVSADDHVDWFMPRAAAMMRVLKPRGTFILNIKEGSHKGERQTYVLELIQAMREQGWRWTEEFIWHKKNPMMGYWKDRFKDGFERLLQFNLGEFDMYHDAVREDLSQSTLTRLAKNGARDIAWRQTIERVGAANKNSKLPSNVLHCGLNKQKNGHPAMFPRALPEFFIKAFSAEGDVVLDPFAGSGTTLFAARDLERRAIGIEIVPKYCRAIEEQTEKVLI